VRIIYVTVFNCFYLNSVMTTTWVALPSAGGMGETISFNIRVWVKRRRDLEITRDLQRRKWMREFPHVWWQTTLRLTTPICLTDVVFLQSFAVIPTMIQITLILNVSFAIHEELHFLVATFLTWCHYLEKFESSFCTKISAFMLWYIH
jgi:hypothetical protein